MVYSYTDVRERFTILLERALADGQIRFRNRDGRLFVIRPEKTAQTSPFDVPSVKANITKAEILEAVRESQDRL